jgi:hypothetical protein
MHGAPTIQPFVVRRAISDADARTDVRSPSALPEGARRIAQDVIDELPRARARGETEVVAFSMGSARLPEEHSDVVLEHVFKLDTQAPMVAAALAERGLKAELVARNEGKGGETRLLISVPVPGGEDRGAGKSTLLGVG